VRTHATLDPGPFRRAPSAWRARPDPNHPRSGSGRPHLDECRQSREENSRRTRPDPLEKLRQGISALRLSGRQPVNEEESNGKGPGHGDVQKPVLCRLASSSSSDHGAIDEKPSQEIGLEHVSVEDAVPLQLLQLASGIAIDLGQVVDLVVLVDVVDGEGRIVRKCVQVKGIEIGEGSARLPLDEGKHTEDGLPPNERGGDQ